MKNPMGKQKWGRGNEIRQKNGFLFGFVGFEGSCVLHSPKIESETVKNFLYVSGGKRSYLNWPHAAHFLEGEKGIISPTKFCCLFFGVVFVFCKSKLKENW